MSCGKHPFDAPIFYQQKQKGAEQRGSYIWALPRTVRVPPQKSQHFWLGTFLFTSFSDTLARAKVQVRHIQLSVCVFPATRYTSHG